ncbi:MAG: hypothetical protein GF364_09515 [Candidatus Lokiarchaeota archaeon]|nr:hypothetical protein [Candidatus Lokiarchaeota archaeon]
MKYDSKKLNELYGNLGQILDGLWFLEVENKLGFEKAFEIDKEVWIKYARKEARRIKKFLDISQPNVENITQLFDLTLFNQSLEYKLEKINEAPTIIRCIVSKCKTLRGMEYVGRSKSHIKKICKEIGLVFFQNMLDELVPKTEIKCISCPYLPENDSNDNDKYVCIWEFRFPKNIDN